MSWLKPCKHPIDEDCDCCPYCNLLDCECPPPYEEWYEEPPYYGLYENQQHEDLAELITGIWHIVHADVDGKGVGYQFEVKTEDRIRNSTPQALGAKIMVINDLIDEWCKKVEATSTV